MAPDPAISRIRGLLARQPLLELSTPPSPLREGPARRMPGHVRANTQISAGT
jgi:hypothetical protein